MVEGEFKKRIDSKILKDGYIDTEDRAYNQGLADALKIADEAFSEFPKLTPEIEKEFPTLWQAALNDKRLEWFKKWSETREK
jgi:hypothetical protein